MQKEGAPLDPCQIIWFLQCRNTPSISAKQSPKKHLYYAIYKPLGYWALRHSGFKDFMLSHEKNKHVYFESQPKQNLTVLYPGQYDLEPRVSIVYSIYPDGTGSCAK